MCCGLTCIFLLSYFIQNWQSLILTMRNTVFASSQMMEGTVHALLYCLFKFGVCVKCFSPLYLSVLWSVVTNATLGTMSMVLALISQKKRKNFLRIFIVICANCDVTSKTEVPGAAGASAPLAQTVRGSTGATGCPFYRNCTSKSTRYSQELEFIIIFKQCLSNLCLIFNQ